MGALGNGCDGHAGVDLARLGSNTAYSLGTFMYPTVNNSNKYDWVVSTAGTSAATSGAEPNWNSCTTTCADGTGTLVWTRQPASCNQLRAGLARLAAQCSLPEVLSIQLPTTRRTIFTTRARAALPDHPFLTGTLSAWLSALAQPWMERCSGTTKERTTVEVM